MKQALTWVGLGAGLMYYLDPDRGRSRRARMRDWIKHQLKEIDEAVGDTAHDLANRTHGLIARTRAALEHDGEHAPDPVIVARVRSKLGHVVSRPHPIVVTAHHGRVALTGPVPADEASRLLAAVASVRGVVGVENRLEICQQPDDHPALQGGRPYAGGPTKFRQKTWSPTMRLLAGTAIAVPALRVIGHGGPAGLALGALALGLAARGLGRGQGQPRHRRSPGRPRSVLATGAPVHDVAIPIHRPRYTGPELGL